MCGFSFHGVCGCVKYPLDFVDSREPPSKRKKKKKTPESEPPELAFLKPLAVGRIEAIIVREGGERRISQQTGLQSPGDKREKKKKKNPCAVGTVGTGCRSSDPAKHRTLANLRSQPAFRTPTEWSDRPRHNITNTTHWILEVLWNGFEKICRSCPIF